MGARTIGEERNDLRDDEGPYPSKEEYASPRSPSNDGMLALVLGILEKAEEDQSGGYRGVKNAEEDQGRDHEREGDLLVERLERSKCRCSHVLSANKGVYDGADKAEDDYLSNCAQPESLGEVPV